jgi:hypothetical protein
VLVMMAALRGKSAPAPKERPSNLPPRKTCLAQELGRDQLRQEQRDFGEYD